MKAKKVRKIMALALCVIQLYGITLGLAPFLYAEAADFQMPVWAEKTVQNIPVELEEEVQEKSGGINLESGSAILMEASTGMVIFEKDADKSLAPASITKIMTLILIFDAINEGKLNLSDEVTVSEHAASMGGSQVYLEVGEKQNVDTMIKCISMASANDACVAYRNSRQKCFAKTLYILCIRKRK